MASEHVEIGERDFQDLLSQYEDALNADSAWQGAGGSAHIPSARDEPNLTRLVVPAFRSVSAKKEVARTRSASRSSGKPANQTEPPAPEGDARRFGHYLVRELIGSGGHALVFRAHDPRIGRDVALKLPRPEALARPEMRKRFMNEAQIAGKLQHPNIVTVYEVGEVDQVCYIASTLCTQQNLANWIEQHRKSHDLLNEQVVVACFREIVAAISYAHRNGVIHRDIKPGNIVFTVGVSRSSGSGGGAFPSETLIPCLTDFGIAKVFDEDTGLTATGALIGTPRYMSPEQAGGFNDKVTEGSDIYSLGVILFEMLTGQVPISGPTQLETLRRIREDAPSTVHSLRPDISPELETICQKCLAKEPRHRYRSAAALGVDLDCFIDGKPIRSRPVGLVPRLIRYCLRRRLLPTTGSFLLIVAAIAWVAFLRAPQSDPTMARPATVASSDSAGASKSGPSITSTNVALVREDYVRDMRQCFSLWTEVAELQGSNAGSRVISSALNSYSAAVGPHDPRGFEWHYLWKHTHPGESGPVLAEMPQLRGHRRDVYSIAFSPDDRVIASGGLDSTVRLWDAETSRQLRIFEGHTNDVACVSFSPDGALLASGCDDGTVRVWNCETGECISKLEASHGWVSALQFSPNGDQIGIGYKDGMAAIWSMETPDDVAWLTGHHGRVLGVSWAPQEHQVVTAGDDGRLIIRDSKDYDSRRTVRFTTENEAHECGPVAWSDDGRLLAVADYILPLTPQGLVHRHRIAPLIKVFEMPSGKELSELTGHTGRIRALEFLSAGPGAPCQLVSTADEGKLLMWNVATGAHWAPISDFTTRSWDLSVSTDGTRIAIAGSDGNSRVYRHQSGSKILAAPEYTTLPTNSPISFALSADGHLLAEASVAPQAGACTLGLWDISSAPPRLLSNATVGAVSSLHFCEDRNALLVTESQDPDLGHEARFYDLPDLALSPETQPPTSIGNTLRSRLSSNGQCLYTVGHPDARNELKITAWDLSSGTSAISLDCSPSYQAMVVPSPNGERFAAVPKHNLEVYDARTLELLYNVESPIESVFALAFTPDSETLAVGRQDGVITFRDSVNGNVIGHTAFNGRHVNALACSPDGKTMAAHAGRELVLIGLPELNTIGFLPLPPDTHDLSGLEFTSDSRTLVANCQRMNQPSVLAVWSTLSSRITVPVSRSQPVTRARR